MVLKCDSLSGTRFTYNQELLGYITFNAFPADFTFCDSKSEITYFKNKVEFIKVEYFCYENGTVSYVLENII
jgi:hypothetical protein